MRQLMQEAFPRYAFSPKACPWCLSFESNREAESPLKVMAKHGKPHASARSRCEMPQLGEKRHCAHARAARESRVPTSACLASRIHERHACREPCLSRTVPIEAMARQQRGVLTHLRSMTRSLSERCEGG